MELVIDANILMSALISTEGKTYDLIFNNKIKLFSPECLFEELEKHKDEILSKSGLTKSDFELFLSLISSQIELVPYSEFERLISQAEDITPDPNDTEYVALALKLKCSIWSNDKKLKEQEGVKIYSTGELMELI